MLVYEGDNGECVCLAFLFLSGSHFTADLFRSIADIRGYEHHITTPHSPWTHGGIERLNRVVIKCMRALLATRGLDDRDWIPVLPAIQECINKQMKVSSRGNRTPLELVTGLTEDTGADYVAWMGPKAALGRITRQEMEASMQGLHDALEGIWATAVDEQHRRRERNARANGVTELPQICVGDYVLVAMATPRSKFSMTWTGPHQVLGPRPGTPFVWIVEPIGSPPGTKPREVHVVRIRRFSNDDLGGEADMDRLLEAARRDFHQDFIQKFVGHRVHPTTGVFLLKVRWIGWGAAGDTEEPIHTMVEDDPHRVEEYLSQRQGDDDCRRYLDEYFH